MLTWLDLETTGLDERVDEILEIGIVITNDELAELASQSWPVRPSNRAVLLSMSEFVRPAIAVTKTPDSESEPISFANSPRRSGT